MTQANTIANPPLFNAATLGDTGAASTPTADNTGTGSGVSSGTLSTTPAALQGTSGVDEKTLRTMFLATGDDQPPLPNVDGEKSSASAAQAPVAAWLTSDPGALSMALATLADCAASNMLAMSVIRQISSKNQFELMLESANQQEAQVKGERASAWTKFGGAVVGAGLVAVAAFFGGKLGFNAGDENVAGWAAAMQAFSNPVMQVTTSLTDLIDKTHGGQYYADQAKIAKAYLDVLVAVFKSEDDMFTSEVQNAQKSLQNIWDITRAVNDQNSQTIINTAGNV